MAVQSGNTLPFLNTFASDENKLNSTLVKPAGIVLGALKKIIILGQIIRRCFVYWLHLKIVFAYRERYCWWEGSLHFIGAMQTKV